MCFIILIISFVITFQHALGQVGDSCLNENGTAVCLVITDCEIALRSIVLTGKHQLSRCGFEDNFEVVCCPQNISEEEQDSVSRSSIADAECEKIVKQYVSSEGVRVINGEKAEPGEFPHMVALAYMARTSHEFRCGGSLITERHIITAAHCVGKGYTPIFARVGMINISDTHQDPNTDYTIEDIVVHPNFSRPLHYHDLAILRLTTPVVTSKSVYPICLYTRAKDTTVALDVTGWGKFNASNSHNDVLLKGKQTIVPQYKCNLSYKKLRRLPYGITSEQICALDMLTRTDACQGDSGGPLQGYTHSDGFYRLVGVTSFGISCATSTPGVYIRVSKYLDWIESVVWPSN